MGILGTLILIVALACMGPIGWVLIALIMIGDSE